MYSSEDTTHLWFHSFIRCTIRLKRFGTSLFSECQTTSLHHNSFGTLSAPVMFFEDDRSYMTHHSPYLERGSVCVCGGGGFGGGGVVLRANKVAKEKMTIINTLRPVLMNCRCIGYMLANHSLTHYQTTKF